VVALVVSLVLLRKRRAEGGSPAALRGEDVARAEEGEGRRSFPRSGNRAGRATPEAKS
jgi:hypothetical protein